MPFIELKTSVSISKEKEAELKSAFGEALLLFLVRVNNGLC